MTVPAEPPIPAPIVAPIVTARVHLFTCGCWFILNDFFKEISMNFGTKIFQIKLKFEMLAENSVLQRVTKKSRERVFLYEKERESSGQ